MSNAASTQPAPRDPQGREPSAPAGDGRRDAARAEGALDQDGARPETCHGVLTDHVHAPGCDSPPRAEAMIPNLLRTKTLNM